MTSRFLTLGGGSVTGSARVDLEPAHEENHGVFTWRLIKLKEKHFLFQVSRQKEKLVGEWKLAWRRGRAACHLWKNDIRCHVSQRYD